MSDANDRFYLKFAPLLLAVAGALVASCEGPPDAELDLQQQAVTTSVIKYVFVITMENHDANQIIGNAVDAPYINGTLVPQYAQASNFNDELPNLPSEPHYIWMEAGTNAFSDHTFTTDGDASSSNSTSSTAHLVTQIKNATNGVTWMSYQEGINSATGACPIASAGFYKPKHNPFVFFKDVSGNPPSKTNAYCDAHHKDASALAADLAKKAVATYNFITPNQCHDMHGQTGCPKGNTIRAGDDWLKAKLPAIISFAKANSGVIFLTWDEGENTKKMPFLAIGAHTKVGYTGSVSYTHGSLVKSIEKILQVPILPKVSSANDFADLFTAGSFP